MSEFKVTPALAAEIVKKGGPTFRPVAGGRYRCNQAKGLGKLNHAEMETLRNACFPRKGASSKASGVGRRREEANPRVARIFGLFGNIECPRCKHIHYGMGRKERIFPCHQCGKPIKAEF